MERFNNFLVATDITDEKRKTAMLLHYAGDSVYDVYKTFDDAQTSYKAVTEKLTGHFAPKKNTVFERHVFRQAKQNAEETLDEFQVRLRKLAVTCEFENVDKELLSQIIEGTASTKLRRSALRDPEITVEKLITLGKSIENAERQAADMEAATEANQQINRVREQENATKNKERYVRKRKTGRREGATCSCCGGRWPHRRGKTSCPAWGETCHRCLNKYHFARCCKTKSKEKLNAVLRGEFVATSSSGESVFHVKRSGSGIPHVNLKLNTKELEFCLDSGAGVNVISEVTWRRTVNEKLHETKTKLTPYGVEGEIPVLGTFTGTFATEKQACRGEVFVVEGSHPSLLCYNTAEALGLIKIVGKVHQVSTVNISKEFPALQNGLGKLKYFAVKLKVDDTVQPVAVRHRRIPFRQRKAVKAEVKRLQALGIIEKVEGKGPTPWVSPVVVVPKKSDPTAVRLCVDMREANRAIRRERHIMPTLDDVLTVLNGARYFSKLDLREGYHQLVLDEESRKVTTFSTHLGLWRYQRLPLGVNAATEIFQEAIRQVLPEEEGVINISDDILVSGRTLKEHDRRLRSVLKSLQEAGLTLNVKKCEVGLNRLTFFGHVFSSEGISVDPAKVEAIKKLTSPEN